MLLALDRTLFKAINKRRITIITSLNTLNLKASIKTN